MFPSLHAVWIAIYNVLRHVTFNPVFWLQDTMTTIIKERKIKQVRQLKSDVIFNDYDILILVYCRFIYFRIY